MTEIGIDIFDTIKPVRAPITERIKIKADFVKDKFTCAICLSLVRRATTVMECLHRFCDDCIKTSLRAGQRTCPSCRTKIPTHRSLREDPDFDALIGSFFPDLDRYEKEEQQRISSINKEAMASTTMSRSFAAGMERQRALQVGRPPVMPKRAAATPKKATVRKTKKASAASKPQNSAQSKAVLEAGQAAADVMKRVRKRALHDAAESKKKQKNLPPLPRYVHFPSQRENEFVQVNLRVLGGEHLANDEDKVTREAYALLSRPQGLFVRFAGEDCVSVLVAYVQMRLGGHKVVSLVQPGHGTVDVSNVQFLCRHLSSGDFRTSDDRTPAQLVVQLTNDTK